MKISKLHIDQYRHLENLDFDFKYPDDFHVKEKRGKALDKICFIGQSATGKTGLLELIYEYGINIISTEIINGNYLSNIRKAIVNSKAEVSFSMDDEILIHKENTIEYKNKIYKSANIGGTVTSLISRNDRKNIFYFKSNLISERNIEIFTKNPLDLFEKYSDQISINQLFNGINSEYSEVFNDEVDAKTWLLLINDILEYRKKFNQKMSELIHKGLLANQNKLSSEFKKWQKDNPNKLEEFAEKFNPILEKLNLEVDIIDTEFSIPIKNKSTEEIIPIQNTSTGTKGLLLSFLPLYKLETKDSIILIDEPERSLYPDMQMDLMEHYQNLAPEAQFIVATHSPFVAASFEPEERFILYFNEEGKVAVRRGSSPIGDDPNDMLKNDFGVNYYNKFGEDAYKKYLKLKEDLAKEKDPIKKKELLLETVKLGDTYNF